MDQISINTENLHKLNTKEDNIFIHKLLGIICLLNYIYRYHLLYSTGSMQLNNKFALLLIFIHGILSISSLIFHIPSIRNSNKPMIYPEFRLHSIVFGLRSVIISVQYYYKLNYFYQILTCFMTMISADIITYLYNNKNAGSTMRNMPFDKSIPEYKQNQVTKMHSFFQIGATCFMLGNIDTAFSPLFAIQIAAFLMTLVRKSIINCTTWHALYSLSLWINIFLFYNNTFGFFLISQLMMSNYKYIFFPYRINKYIAWSGNFGIFIIYKKLELEVLIENVCNKYVLVFIPNLKLIIITYMIVYYIIKFKILFINYNNNIM